MCYSDYDLWNENMVKIELGSDHDRYLDNVKVMDRQLLIHMSSVKIRLTQLKILHA